MPKGHHYGRAQKRAYTDGYKRVYANAFKCLLTASLGKYSLDGGNLTNEHRKLELIEIDNNLRVMVFTINNTPHQIALKLDNRSVSNKLYITCPYCKKNGNTFTLSKQLMFVGNVSAYITPAKVKEHKQD